MDLASALTMEGLLEKESPGLFKVFQTRYFAIRGKGEFLVWFKKKPLNPDQNPKGIINIETISQINEEEDEDRLFSIVYLQRTFTLRAESAAVKQRWVNSLKTILNHMQKVNKNRAKQQDSSPQSWKWKSNANQSITEQIREENQKVILQNAQSITGKRSQAFLAYVTKQKSLFDVQKCIVYGFYNKKKLLTSSLRWYFLASGANLKDEKDEQLNNATQQLLVSLNEPVTVAVEAKQQPGSKKRRKYSSSSQQQVSEMKTSKDKKPQKSKNFCINTLFEYDEQTKELKNVYNIIDIVTYEMSIKQQPFELKITYEEIINQEEEEIKENQIILTSNFLIEIKKLYSAIKIIDDKYNMQKQREMKNATKSKRYPVKKWRYVNEDQWRIPQEKAAFYVLLNKKFMRLNMLTVNLQEITSHSKESIKIPTAEPQSDDKDKDKDKDDKKEKEKQKKEDALLIVYKKEKDEYKIYIQFDKMQTMTKFAKRLGKNVKKIQQAIQAENASKTINISEQKKNNQDTYLIDKKIRQSNASIKVNFYELMDREVIIEKKEENPNKNNGIFAKIMGMFCAGPINLDLST